MTHPICPTGQVICPVAYLICPVGQAVCPVGQVVCPMGQKAKATGPAAVETLSAWIDDSYDRERSMVAAVEPLLQGVDRLRKDFFRLANLPREQRVKRLTVLDRLAAAIRKAPGLLRDARWRMIALRPEIEPAGDSPIFDDPDKLLEHLQAHRE